MKQQLIVILFIISSSAVYGQVIFPANDTSLISGKLLKIKQLGKVFEIMGYEGFYKDEKLKEPFDCCVGTNSKHNNLVDKVFKVKRISAYRDEADHEKYKIKLHNSQTGNIYFDYDPADQFKWHFEFVGDFVLPEDFYCRNIRITVDKETGDTTYATPPADGFQFINVKNGSRATVYLLKNEPASTLTTGPKGLTLLLENGKRFEKSDEDIDVKTEPNGASYLYSVLIELSESDIQLLLKNAILASRLYIYEGTVTQGKRLTEFLKCLTEK